MGLPPKRYKMARAAPEDERRLKALNQWSEILRYDLQASKVGRQIEEEEGHEAEEEVVRLSLRDKRTATLVARAGPVLSYIRWGFDGVEWPPSERAAYEFLKATAGQGQAATRANSFMEAMRFIHHVLGFDVEEVISSRRLEGFAVDAMARLGMRKLSPLIHHGLVGAWETEVANGVLKDQ
eukprot:10005834-Karenia_brevis.AAC.1